VKSPSKLIIPSLVWLFFIVSLGYGRDSKFTSADCVINQISPSNRSLKISCSLSDLPAGKIAIQFVDQFAGIDRLGERVHALKINTAKGAGLSLEIRGNGSYYFIADQHSDAVQFSYEMRLARALDPSQYALVSSLGADSAVLILADLLPLVCPAEKIGDERNQSARLKVAPPEGWQIATTEPRQNDFFDIADISRAVFFLGRLKTQPAKIGRMNVLIAMTGEWNFLEAEVFRLAEAIAREQSLMIGSQEKGDFLIALAPFPQPLTGLRSSAVTVGRTALLLLNPNNDADQSFKHFRRHLAHEIFHFYLPNAFRIRENFDWFWEGYTRYVALMTLARLQLIDLQEYLDAISAEYESYYFNPSRLQLSLVAASPEKFTSTDSYDLVYHKGMLVAALYDWDLRWQSRGKFHLADVMKSLYENYAIKKLEVGNQEVLETLGGFGELSGPIRDDILGTREINLAERAKTYGLIIEQSAATRGRARLKTRAKLSKREREFISGLAKDR